MIFNNETELQFSGKFLSITISTNKVVFTAIHTIKVDTKTHSYEFSNICDPSDPSDNAAN